ncbi:unnamed protein product [Vitrella brassicaformis CCMP3155]|uniref:Apple domain-containing protein n=3 Tax=Vitrella brassicaformis TaxID=1169539 RepID=A0A0G4G6I2_VITBC|nr:unnamed protein product [Vitrella brassicaformis CCMP3155]|eukprot:CEM24075.1 unnamed protein product [Vitrella brassicaformis CCMP3155]
MGMFPSIVCDLFTLLLLSLCFVASSDEKDKKKEAIGDLITEDEYSESHQVRKLVDMQEEGLGVPVSYIYPKGVPIKDKMIVLGREPITDKSLLLVLQKEGKEGDYAGGISDAAIIKPTVLPVPRGDDSRHYVRYPPLTPLERGVIVHKGDLEWFVFELWYAEDICMVAYDGDKSKILGCTSFDETTKWTPTKLVKVVAKGDDDKESVAIYTAHRSLYRYDVDKEEWERVAFKDKEVDIYSLIGACEHVLFFRALNGNLCMYNTKDKTMQDLGKIFFYIGEEVEETEIEYQGDSDVTFISGDTIYHLALEYDETVEYDGRLLIKAHSLGLGETGKGDTESDWLISLDKEGNKRLIGEVGSIQSFEFLFKFGDLLYMRYKSVEYGEKDGYQLCAYDGAKIYQLADYSHVQWAAVKSGAVYFTAYDDQDKKLYLYHVEEKQKYYQGDKLTDIRLKTNKAIEWKMMHGDVDKWYKGKMLEIIPWEKRNTNEEQFPYHWFVSYSDFKIYPFFLHKMAERFRDGYAKYEEKWEDYWDSDRATKPDFYEEIEPKEAMKEVAQQGREAAKGKDLTIRVLAVEPKCTPLEYYPDSHWYTFLPPYDCDKVVKYKKTKIVRITMENPPEQPDDKEEEEKRDDDDEIILVPKEEDKEKEDDKDEKEEDDEYYDPEESLTCNDVWEHHGKIRDKIDHIKRLYDDMKRDLDDIKRQYDRIKSKFDAIKNYYTKYPWRIEMRIKGKYNELKRICDRIKQRTYEGIKREFNRIKREYDRIKHQISRIHRHTDCRLRKKEYEEVLWYHHNIARYYENIWKIYDGVRSAHRNMDDKYEELWKTAADSSSKLIDHYKDIDDCYDAISEKHERIKEKHDKIVEFYEKIKDKWTGEKDLYSYYDNVHKYYDYIKQRYSVVQWFYGKFKGDYYDEDRHTGYILHDYYEYEGYHVPDWYYDKKREYTIIDLLYAIAKRLKDIYEKLPDKDDYDDDKDDKYKDDKYRGDDDDDDDDNGDRRRRRLTLSRRERKRRMRALEEIDCLKNDEAIVWKSVNHTPAHMIAYNPPAALLNASSVEECQALCFKSPTCKYVTYLDKKRRYPLVDQDILAQGIPYSFPIISCANQAVIVPIINEIQGGVEQDYESEYESEAAARRALQTLPEDSFLHLDIFDRDGKSKLPKIGLAAFRKIFQKILPDRDPDDDAIVIVLLPKLDKTVIIIPEAEDIDKREPFDADDIRTYLQQFGENITEYIEDRENRDPPFPVLYCINETYFYPYATEVGETVLVPLLNTTSTRAEGDEEDQILSADDTIKLSLVLSIRRSNCHLYTEMEGQENGKYTRRKKYTGAYTTHRDCELPGKVPPAVEPVTTTAAPSPVYEPDLPSDIEPEPDVPTEPDVLFKIDDFDEGCVYLGSTKGGRFVEAIKWTHKEAKENDWKESEEKKTIDKGEILQCQSKCQKKASCHYFNLYLGEGDDAERICKLYTLSTLDEEYGYRNMPLWTYKDDTEKSVTGKRACECGELYGDCGDTHCCKDVNARCIGGLESAKCMLWKDPCVDEEQCYEWSHLPSCFDDGYEIVDCDDECRLSLDSDGQQYTYYRDESDVATVYKCQALCWEDEKCEHFTYYWADKECRLFTETKGYPRRKAKSAITGPKNCHSRIGKRLPEWWQDPKYDEVSVFVEYMRFVDVSKLREYIDTQAEKKGRTLFVPTNEAWEDFANAYPHIVPYYQEILHVILSHHFVLSRIDPAKIKDEKHTLQLASGYAYDSQELHIYSKLTQKHKLSCPNCRQAEQYDGIYRSLKTPVFVSLGHPYYGYTSARIVKANVRVNKDTTVHFIDRILLPTDPRFAVMMKTALDYTDTRKQYPVYVPAEAEKPSDGDFLAPRPPTPTQPPIDLDDVDLDVLQVTIKAFDVNDTDAEEIIMTKNFTYQELQELVNNTASLAELRNVVAQTLNVSEENVLIVDINLGSVNMKFRVHSATVEDEGDLTLNWMQQLQSPDSPIRIYDVDLDQAPIYRTTGSRLLSEANIASGASGIELLPESVASQLDPDFLAKTELEGRQVKGRKKSKKTPVIIVALVATFSVLAFAAIVSTAVYFYYFEKKGGKPSTERSFNPLSRWFQSHTPKEPQAQKVPNLAAPASGMVEPSAPELQAEQQQKEKSDNTSLPVPPSPSAAKDGQGTPVVTPGGGRA